MKRLIGYTLFWIAAGMAFALFIENVFIQIAAVIVLMLAGYNLFLC